MKKLLVVLLSIFNLNVVMAAGTPVNQPFLYEISKNGQTAYMLGTMHLDIQLADFPTFVTDKLAAASTVIIETNMDDAQNLATTLFMAGPSTPLNQLLTPAQWTRLVDAFKTVGVTEAQLIRAFPMSVLQQYIQIQIRNPNFRATTPAPAMLDAYIFEYAKTNNKGLDFLEPVQVQLDIMKVTMGDAKTLSQVLDLGTKNELITWVIQMNTDQTKLMNDMNAAYFGGDLLALEQLSTNGMDANMKNMFLNERNRAWIAEFNRITAKPGTEFFAFGAGHLSGTEGVINLLTVDGFKVSRITQ